MWNAVVRHPPPSGAHTASPVPAPRRRHAAPHAVPASPRPRPARGSPSWCGYALVRAMSASSGPPWPAWRTTVMHSLAMSGCSTRAVSRSAKPQPVSSSARPTLSSAQAGHGLRQLQGPVQRQVLGQFKQYILALLQHWPLRSTGQGLRAQVDAPAARRQSPLGALQRQRGAVQLHVQRAAAGAGCGEEPIGASSTLPCGPRDSRSRLAGRVGARWVARCAHALRPGQQVCHECCGVVRRDAARRGVQRELQPAGRALAAVRGPDIGRQRAPATPAACACLCRYPGPPAAAVPRPPCGFDGAAGFFKVAHSVLRRRRNSIDQRPAMSCRCCATISCWASRRRISASAASPFSRSASNACVPKMASRRAALGMAMASTAVWPLGDSHSASWLSCVLRRAWGELAGAALSAAGRGCG